jgi:hypothetical protein
MDNPRDKNVTGILGHVALKPFLLNPDEHTDENIDKIQTNIPEIHHSLAHFFKRDKQKIAKCAIHKSERASMKDTQDFYNDIFDQGLGRSRIFEKVRHFDRCDLETQVPWMEFE